MSRPSITLPELPLSLRGPLHRAIGHTALPRQVKLTFPTNVVAVWWRRAEQRLGRVRLRAAAATFAVLMLLTVCLPAIEQLGLGKYYQLDAAALKLVGATDTSLTKQLTYDAANQAYVFNKDVVSTATSQTTTSGAASAVASLQKAAVGAKDKSNTKTYALTVPEDFSEGVTYYDANSSLSFKLVPQFNGMRAKTEQGHLVFPLSGNQQAVYTLKNNGLKEDIILPSIQNDTEVYRYRFEVPKSLEVRIIPDSNGAIGVYSADPALYGNVSYGSDADRVKVEAAREKAEKTNLVFALPAPIITSEGGKSIGKASARFELKGSELSVVAENLKTAGDQPLSIDPSVVVTSTSDFQFGGNDEGNIDFSTSGQVTRGGLTGGDVGSWAATSSISGNLEFASSVFYNDYIYLLKGTERGGAGQNALVRYAQVNSNGTLGTWTNTTSLAEVGANGAAIAYNGYLYYMGGVSNAVNLDKVYYAHINSDGTVGSWIQTTSLPETMRGFGYAAANGYVYILGKIGTSGDGVSTTVYYARLLPSGAVGAWGTTTSLTYNRGYFDAHIYNGYIYIFGGANSTPTFLADVQYAKINADGTLGSWMTTNSFTNARYGMASAIYNGYAYIYGGWTTSTAVQYAQVNANGSLGTWTTSTSSFTNARRYVVGGAYKGYLYIGTGLDQIGGTTDYADFQYTKIEPQGKTVVVKSNSNTFATARRYVQTVAIYGQLYVIGGDTGSAATTAVGRMPINTDGTLGTYTTTSIAQLGTARMLFGAFAYDGYMYVLGGCKSALASCDTSGNALNTVYSAPIISGTGALGTWVAQTSFTTARYGFATGMLGSYIYIMGGTADGGGSPLNSIEYASFDYTAGTVGSWTTASSTYNLPAGLTNMAYATNGNTMYLAGGCTAGTAASCSTLTNAVYHIKLSGTGGLASTWSTDTSFTTARYGVRMTAINGVLYLAGGYDGTSYYSDVQYGLIGSGSGVSSWQTSNPITTTAGTVTSLMGASLTTQNGMLYIAGGYNGSYQNSIFYAAVNNGGRGQTGTWVTNATDMSSIYASGVGFARSVALNGYVYVIGGAGASTLSTVSYAPLNADGTVGSWTTTSSLQASRLQHAAFAYNGYLYAIGGQTSGGTRIDTTEYAKVNSDGTLGTWTYTSSLNSTWGGLSGIDGAIYKGYMYITGGLDNSASVQNEVQYAQINANGTLGSWTATTSFTTARDYHSTIALNGYLYIMGGYAGAGNYFADVQMAPINSDGSVGSWTYTSSLPIACARMIVTPYNGYVYLYGGNTNTGAVAVGTNVWYAPINADGSIGDWQMTIGSTFTTARAAAAGVIYNGFMYLLGGNTTPFYYDVQYAPVSVISRKGQYSTQIAINAKTINSIVVNGVLPGLGSVAYTAFSANGTVVASGRSSDGVSIIGTACSTAVSSAAYLYISVTLDDTASGGATFPDASSAANAANVTDITITYESAHPSPFIRLRHGQTLQTGALSPLDTCIAT